jgi:hypothetical protein
LASLLFVLSPAGDGGSPAHLAMQERALSMTKFHKGLAAVHYVRVQAVYVTVLTVVTKAS